MSIQEREQQALEVYLKLLKSKGFGPETFAQRINFLNKLMPLLADKAARCLGVAQVTQAKRAFAPRAPLGYS